MKSVGVLTIKNIATTKRYTYIASKRARIAVSNSILFNNFRSFSRHFFSVLFKQNIIAKRIKCVFYKLLLQFLKYTNTKRSHSSKMEPTQFRKQELPVDEAHFFPTRFLGIRFSIIGKCFGFWLIVVLSGLHYSVPKDVLAIILLAFTIFRTGRRRCKIPSVLLL